MPLFQSSVSTKYLKALDKQAVQAAYTKFKAHFHNPTIQENIRNSKEEQYQEGFLNDLFVTVLGYTKNPAEYYNLTTEYKNVKDSKKADGAIIARGHAPLVIGVIELKGTNVTDLGHVEVQAFSYKNNQPECVYVITSNFEKLRFYIDNAIEFLEFNLFTLTEKDFELLYLCLAYSQIEKGIPKKIKDESITHEDDITKLLYRDYSLFKRELHADLVSKNPEYDTLVLFRKSQKLLSRFLFLFFAEDRELLPPNSVRLILNDWRDLQERDVEIPLYDRFKKYFEYLNTGFKGKRYDVFAYNGGLFKPDAILDAVQIDDELLYKHTVKISDYDFASEVDVNILGHIFENSLNELDELKAEIAGETIDKSKTKRKKDGVFYTPKYITKYIVDNTVGRLCSEKKAELGIREEDYSAKGHAPLQKKTKLALADKLALYREWLLQITICDPACGSGAFLNQALNFLIDEHRYIDELQAKLFGDALVMSDIENTILENNLFGVDLNEESVEIARLSLWLRTAQPNRKLNDLSNNIKCGNSLIDDPTVAGEKAFDWGKEFPQVFGREPKADILITPEKNESPDYLKLVQDKLLASQLKAEQALELSKEAIEISKEAYEYAQKLETVSEPKHKYENRKTGFDVVIANPPYVRGRVLEDNERRFLDKYEISSNDTAILFIKKGIEILKENGLLSYIVPKSLLYASNWDKIRNQIYKYLYKVIDCGQVWNDVLLEQVIFAMGTKLQKNYISGFRLDSAIHELDIVNNNVVDIFNFLPAQETAKSLEIAKKIQDSSISLNAAYDNIAGVPFQKYINENGNVEMIGGAEFDRFNIKNIKGKIDEKWTSSNNAMIKENSLIVQNIIAHILYPTSHIKITACIPSNEHIDKTSLSNTVNQLILKSELKNRISNRYVWCILNSKLINWYVYRFVFAKAIRTMHFYNPISEKVPFKYQDISQQPFIAKADQMLSLNKELQEVSGKFQRNLKREFALDTLSSKLQNWHSLSYAEFIKELEKLKVKLSLHQKAEWETYFEQEADKARTLKTEIESTDREIDQLVYQLYGLTEEEIGIVEEIS